MTGLGGKRNSAASTREWRLQPGRD